MIYRFRIEGLEERIPAESMRKYYLPATSKYISLFNKVKKMEIQVLEFGLRKILKDPPTTSEIKKLILDYSNDQGCLCKMSDVLALINFINDRLEISEEEALTLLESRIVKFDFISNSIDIITLINERDINGSNT